MEMTARLIVLSGIVQGVGFRPFIYRLALKHELRGWVRNCVGVVEIHVQGPAATLDNFTSDIFTIAPPLAQPYLESERTSDVSDYQDFSILPSRSDSEARISVPADLFLCDDCLAELNDPSDRRYHYPFINCTQCGPRYTLIQNLPYDRKNTTMAEFELCPACQAEYTNPADRRFHAEPIACPECGPSLSFHRAETFIHGNEVALNATVDALRRGGVVAVKGIGGYHLMCDAGSTEAVVRLRENKSRPHKPFAVMFPAPPENPFSFIELAAVLNAEDKAFLRQPARPILLLRKRDEHSSLSEQIAPGLNEVGVLLPYSPLHHLLLNAFAGPLVVTSANISGEPVLTDDQQVEKRLSQVADAFLHHNRLIQRPADDPVYRTIAGKARPIRSGRGSAPLELELPFELDRPVLAVGAHMKNTVALAWGNRVVISPHIGDMDAARSLEVFQNTIKDLQLLYDVKAEHIICDAHPGYSASRWARKQDIPVSSVWHHHAHASAAFYECQQTCHKEQAVLVFTWDGVGYGEDGTLWGGETFLGRPGHWQRVASMRPFHLPGGDKAGREPWRSAAAICWESGQDYTDSMINNSEHYALLKQAWQRKINTLQTTSVGRLFDAAAALTGVSRVASFEGQGPMLLEALAEMQYSKDEIKIESDLSYLDNILIYNWSYLLDLSSDSTLSVAERASLLHASLAQVILQQARLLREKYAVNTVSFCGGVFQNRVLSEQAIALLRANGFDICFPELIPVNDAGISFGQVMEHGFK